PLRVFVVASATLGNLSVVDRTSDTGPAFALLSHGDIQVTGTITVASSAGEITSGCLGTSGQLVLGDPQGVFDAGSGGGGGGNGGITSGQTAGVGGNPAGTDHLVPLQGGCPGAPGLDENNHPLPGFGGLGGGAIQLTSETAIRIDGVIDVRGQDGFLEDYGQ